MKRERNTVGMLLLLLCQVGWDWRHAERPWQMAGRSRGRDGGRGLWGRWLGIRAQVERANLGQAVCEEREDEEGEVVDEGEQLDVQHGVEHA